MRTINVKKPVTVVDEMGTVHELMPGKHQLTDEGKLYDIEPTLLLNEGTLKEAIRDGSIEIGEGEGVQ
jgi:hypothetical protein